MHRNWLTPRNARTLTFLSCGFLALLGACSNGGSNGPAAVLAEIEPNATTAEALPLSLGRAASGDVVTAGDTDLWKLDLAAGEIVKLELRATRLDQDTWDAANNVPRLTVFDTDGTSKLLEHDYSGTFSDGWGWGEHDLDIPLFRAPADGSYYLQVAQDDALSAGGDYALTASLVNLGTQQVEAEAVGVIGGNDTVATAETIVPGIVRGFHVDDEVDHYSFAITGPTLVDFEMTAYRNGVYAGDDEYYDTSLELIDSDGVTVLQSNDDTYFYDSALHFVIETAGTYTVQVNECCGAGDAGYFLRFGVTSLASATAEAEANDTFGTANAVTYGTFVTGAMDTGEEDFFSFTGTAGDTVHLETYDADNGQSYADDVVFELLDSDGVTPLATDSGDTFETTRTILTSTGTFYVHVTPDGTPIATNYAFRVKRYRSATFETEPNDTTGTAETFPSSGRAAGVVDPAADVDLFSFTASANRLVTFSLYADDGDLSAGVEALGGNGSTLDPLVIIRNTDGDILAKSGGSPVNLSAESVTDGLATLAVSFIAPASGTYTVEVTDASSSGSATHTWVLVKH